MAQNNGPNTPVEYIGFLEILTLIFVTLKLVGVIGWSWWWVLLPLWGQLVVFGILLIVAFSIVVYKEFK